MDKDRTVPVSSASELLARYAYGERDFSTDRFFGSYSAIRERRERGAAKLNGVDLGGADLSSSRFGEAELREVNLRGANLSGANLACADLHGANLAGARLDGANLTSANLERANLCGAELACANLAAANLTGADLSGARMDHADLGHARFTRANLSGAVLGGANLTGAHFQHARISADTRLGSTLMVDIHLGPFCRALPQHGTPSHVDFRSIVKSVREPRLKEFLLRTGMPDIFVEYMVDCASTLDPAGVFSLFQSTFISYGAPDEEFARKLNRALEGHGVVTFFFSDDALPGEKLHRLMRNGVANHDRLIVICSASSLSRSGLMNEVEECLAREARDGGRAYLIPIRIDDYVFEWRPERSDIAQTVRDRVIADFREHCDPSAFNSELAKLLRVLKKPLKS